MEIRKYQANDKLNCQNICLLTAPSTNDERKKQILLNLYNDYYTEQEPQNCFVLDDDGIAVGYIITSADFNEYSAKFKSIYLPELKKLSLPEYVIKRLSLSLEKRIAKKYPSHLHIDILPEYTGKGFGGKLIDLACENLAASDSKGIFLGVSYFNKKAVKFYKNHGFTVKLSIFPFVRYMAKLFD